MDMKVHTDELSKKIDILTQEKNELVAQMSNKKLPSTSGDSYDYY
jgi:uncharacterized small protein (DUF1192 family)